MALSKMPGGYLDGSGTPSSVLAFGLGETNEALAMMIQALKDHDIYESTLFIVSAKHGQSPINPFRVNNRLAGLGGLFAWNKVDLHFQGLCRVSWRVLPLLDGRHSCF
jgi:Type I phosphodiesterase / nucleotide pyrophosphatase